MSQSIYLSESLERELKLSFHDCPEILECIGLKREVKEPIPLMEKLKDLSKKKLLPSEVIEAFDQQKEKLLYMKAKDMDVKYKSTGKYIGFLKFKKLLPDYYPTPKASN